MKNLIITSILFASSGAFAAAEDDIDALFEKAGAAEKVGDCTTAGEAYGQIDALAQSLPPDEKARITSQARTRQARKKKCIDACTLTDKDKKLFETAKKAKAANETKRVGEMCKQLMHSKTAGCSSFEEIKSFCPQLAENGDPCTNVSAETKTELEKLDGEVDALQSKAQKAQAAAKGGGTRALDGVLAVNRNLEDAYDRLFELREKYFNCDKVYGSLREKASGLAVSKSALRSAAQTGYKNAIGHLSTNLAELKKNNAELSKSNADVTQKLEALSEFTDALALDVIGMAQVESVAMTVKIEGKKEPSDELPKVLQGDREAIDLMLKQHPEFFSDGSGRAGLVKKKESLERLDKLLTKLSGQGHGERLGFKKAQQEISATLTLVKAAIPPEQEGKTASAGTGMPWGKIGGFGGFLLAISAMFFLLRGRGEPKGATLALNLTPAMPATPLGSSKRAAAMAAPAPVAAAPVAAAAPARPRRHNPLKI